MVHAINPSTQKAETKIIGGQPVLHSDTVSNKLNKNVLGKKLFSTNLWQREEITKVSEWLPSETYLFPGFLLHIQLRPLV